VATIVAPGRAQAPLAVDERAAGRDEHGGAAAQPARQVVRLGAAQRVEPCTLAGARPWLRVDWPACCRQRYSTRGSLAVGSGATRPSCSNQRSQKSMSAGHSPRGA
jgi:hypothetical protein